MEAAQHRVADRERKRESLGDIFRETGRVAGGERKAVLDAEPAYHVTDRAFGGDMERVRRRGRDPLGDPPAARQREANVRIGRKADGWKAFGGLEIERDAERPRAFAER